MRILLRLLVLLIVVALGGCDQLSVLLGTGQLPVGKAPPGASPRGPIYGQVLDDSGRPAAGVSVAAYSVADSQALIGNAGSSLAGNAGSGLAGNAGASYRFASRRNVASVSAKTDGNGYFVLKPQATGSYNLEAVKDDNAKAWRAQVLLPSLGAEVAAGNLRLAPTGTISGKVRAASTDVTEFPTPSSTCRGRTISRSPSPTGATR